MKEDCGICLEIRFAKRPGYDMKCPLLMDMINVNVKGLKAAACNYLASLRLVLS